MGYNSKTNYRRQIKKAARNTEIANISNTYRLKKNNTSERINSK